jgi:hypothetical protein
MYILTSQGYGQKQPHYIQASKKPAFVDKVEAWLEAAEIEGEAADEIRNGVTTVTNQSDEIVQMEVDGLKIEIYHEYKD